MAHVPGWDTATVGHMLDRVEDSAPVPVRELASRGLWLEQERIVLDPRMVDALEATLRAEAPG